ncbi:hypothetical protein FB45DRAFT_867670 [Roridomyces roridus]|uniref:Uncharacterized protein n=1 Tax=Roridomyces roridus TaxID=1738132 RepID=A0AAD7BRW6_9AGAR|nr:hypothetical protein FB45DRAFT_867670 [Roridomyces roridus]
MLSLLFERPGRMEGICESHLLNCWIASVDQEAQESTKNSANRCKSRRWQWVARASKNSVRDKGWEWNLVEIGETEAGIQITRNGMEGSEPGDWSRSTTSGVCRFLEFEAASESFGEREFPKLPANPARKPEFVYHFDFERRGKVVPQSERLHDPRRNEVRWDSRRPDTIVIAAGAAFRVFVEMPLGVEVGMVSLERRYRGVGERSTKKESRFVGPAALSVLGQWGKWALQIPQAAASGARIQEFGPTSLETSDGNGILWKRSFDWRDGGRYPEWKVVGLESNRYLPLLGVRSVPFEEHEFPKLPANPARVARPQTRTVMITAPPDPRNSGPNSSR